MLWFHTIPGKVAVQKPKMLCGKIPKERPGAGANRGMIPKLETCLAAVESSIEAAHILDGRVPHVLLLEIFTKHGTGTMIEADRAASS